MEKESSLISTLRSENFLTECLSLHQVESHKDWSIQSKHRQSFQSQSCHQRIPFSSINKHSKDLLQFSSGSSITGYSSFDIIYESIPPLEYFCHFCGLCKALQIKIATITFKAVALKDCGYNKQQMNKMVHKDEIATPVTVINFMYHSKTESGHKRSIPRFSLDPRPFWLRKEGSGEQPCPEVYWELECCHRH